MGKKIVFALVLTLGIFLRLWQLNSLPGGLFLDEINMALDAKTLAQNGVDQYGHHFPFYFEDATDFKLPGYIYMATLSYKVFGNTILTMHLPSAMAGILSIFLIGYLAFLLFPEKKYIGYFASTVLALSPFAIHFSRISYETNIALTMLLLYFISLLQVIRNARPKLWLAIGSIAILIGDWTYPSPRFIIPVFTVLFLPLCYFLLFPKTKRKQVIRSLLFIGVAAITFIPTIIFPYADARQLNLLVVDTKGQTLLQSLFLKSVSVIASYIRLWNLEFLFDKGDLFAYRHGTKQNGVFMLIFILPYVLSIFWSIKNFSRKNFSLVFLFLLALVAGLPSALSNEVPYGTRAVPMLIPYTLLIALGMHIFFTWVGKQKLLLKKTIALLITGILVYQIGLFTYIYFVDFKETSLPEFPTAPVQLSSYIMDFHATYPTTPIYFLTDRTCHTWGNDAEYLWYYADLPNANMIAWNNAFRSVRYQAKGMSPFEAYDRVSIPAVYIAKDNLYLFSGNEAQAKSVPGSLLVRCGYQLTSYNKATESLVKVFYMYSTTNTEPYYVVTEKK